MKPKLTRKFSLCCSSISPSLPDGFNLFLAQFGFHFPLSAPPFVKTVSIVFFYRCAEKVAWIYAPWIIALVADRFFRTQIQERDLKTYPVGGGFLVIQPEPAISLFVSASRPNPTLASVFWNQNLLPKVSHLMRSEIDGNRIRFEAKRSGIHGLIVNAVSGFRRYDAGNRVLLCQSD